MKKYIVFLFLAAVYGLRAADPSFVWKDAKISLDTPTKALFVNHKLMAYIEKMDNLWALWGKDGHIIDKYDDLKTAQNDAEEQFVPKVESRDQKASTDTIDGVLGPFGGITRCEVYIVLPDVDHVYCGDHELTVDEIKALPDDIKVRVYSEGDPDIPKHTTTEKYNKKDPDSGPRVIHAANSYHKVGV